MAGDRTLLRDVIGGFAPGQSLRASLLLTFSFDGAWLEEGLVPDLFDRQVGACLLLRDGNAILREAPSVRYHRANAQYSSRVFHSKLLLLVADDRALAVVGSANLTRGGLERNLELASVYEVSPEGGPREFFAQMYDYLAGPLAREVSGTAGATLADSCVALAEVLRNVPKDGRTRVVFLHNYEKTIWEQVLAQLPHRHVAQVTIVSPFFESNCAAPEDPGIEPGDEGIFARLFADLKLKPSGPETVTVYFQASEGETQLPLDKLRTWQDQIALYQRVATSDEARPLHAKLLLIEGARGPNREPYLISLHGSPNFTSAALLARPPQGNAEIAVLTHLPWKRNSHAQVRAALQLDTLFCVVTDWDLLRHVAPQRQPFPAIGSFRIVDVSLRVADRRLSLTWTGSTLGARSVHVLVELNGAWVSIGVVEIGNEEHAELAVPLLATLDDNGLLSLQASRVRVELRDDNEQVLASSDAPVNVDCPADFCGLAMVGPLMASLDEQIARAGCGSPMTYREQLRFLEQRRTERKSPQREVSVLTHQADLDRFYRNLHSGFKGLRARREALPNSEYTLRRTVKDLARWCTEAIRDDSPVPTVECRVFLVDRLSREIERMLDSVQESQKLAGRMCAIAGAFALKNAVQSAATWAMALADPRIAPYLTGTVNRLQSIENRIGEP